MFWFIRPTSRTPTGTITPGLSGSYTSWDLLFCIGLFDQSNIKKSFCQITLRKERFRFSVPSGSLISCCFAVVQRELSSRPAVLLGCFFALFFLRHLTLAISGYFLLASFFVVSRYFFLEWYKLNYELPIDSTS